MSNRLKLLVVDDEPAIRAGIVRSLKNFSVGYPFMEEDFMYDILEASTGKEAFEILKSQPIDIVLLDNKLPDMEGVEILHYVKDQNYDAAVIMITAYASLDLAIKATSFGAYHFIPKPFTPLELRVAVENITKNLYLRRMTRKMYHEGKENRFQFLSILSHELKSPLNAVEGYLRMMKEKQLGENIHDYMMMIDRSMERIKGMRTLIMDLLDLTRIESGPRKKNLQMLDLVNVLKGVLDTMVPMAIQKDITFSLDVPENLNFLCDRNDIEIIMNNLISNAIKYNIDHGKVFIVLKSKEKEVVFEVSDTGIGMDEEELKLLFKEFVRIKNEKTQNITGSGLGLSIVKKIVESYQGKIEVASIPDQGSTFRVILPLN
ncbi:MAG: ATP-binding protein [Bacteroidales bacterium]|nr:ATP-binding protein [Bacteroidales bacterium]